VIRKFWINGDFRVLGLSILGVSKKKRKKKRCSQERTGI
jgi:hypothetical protein